MSVIWLETPDRCAGPALSSTCPPRISVQIIHPEVWHARASHDLERIDGIFRGSALAAAGNELPMAKYDSVGMSNERLARLNTIRYQ